MITVLRIDMDLCGLNGEYLDYGRGVLVLKAPTDGHTASYVAVKSFKVDVIHNQYKFHSDFTNSCDIRGFNMCTKTVNT